MTQPLVTISFPVYEGDEYVAESIKSVLNQDYENLEIIIIDDCGKTNAMQIVRDCVKRYGKRIITQSWELNRRSLQGMKDAVAELFCLGKCHHVIGSKNSTFSIYAARLYDKPFIAPNEE